MARITEKITIETENPNCENPFYIRWLASGGSRPYDRRPRAGWGYWLFDYSQNFGIEGQDGPEAQPYISDYSTAETARKVLNKTVYDVITLTTEVTELDHVRGLQTIIGSLKSQVLITGTANDWQDIYPVQGSFSSYETKSNFWEVSFQVKLDNNVLNKI